MKIHALSPAKNGNVLVICICTCALIGFAIASCFAMVRNQMVAVARSQTWNESLVLSEAGIEDGLMLINKYSGTSTPRGAWAGTAASDNWSLISGTTPNVFWVRRTMDANYYDVYLTNNANGRPTMRAVGTKTWLTGPGSPSSIRRAIVVSAVPGSLYQGGLIAKGGITLGGTVLVDSFNSQLSSMSTNGQYTPALRNDGGVIATASSNVVAIVSVGGSVDVYGKIFTGPEDSINMNGGNVSVGSESFIDGGGNGLQSGWSQNDLNVYIPDAPNPPSGGLPLPAKTDNTMQGTNYTSSYLLTSGIYQPTTDVKLTSSDKILVNGNVSLYMPKDFAMAGQSQIIIGKNSSLTIYAGGSVDLSGGGVMNQTGFATNLTVYGLPSSKSIQYTGGSDFTGTIYAPQAALKMSGGGNNIYNFIGSAVAGTITLQGKYQVHYDESLNQLPAGPHYYVSSWREIAL